MTFSFYFGHGHYFPSCTMYKQHNSVLWSQTRETYVFLCFIKLMPGSNLAIVFCFVGFLLLLKLKRTSPSFERWTKKRDLPLLGKGVSEGVWSHVLIQVSAHIERLAKEHNSHGWQRVKAYCLRQKPAFLCFQPLLTSAGKHLLRPERPLVSLKLPKDSRWASGAHVPKLWAHTHKKAP